MSQKTGDPSASMVLILLLDASVRSTVAVVSNEVLVKQLDSSFPPEEVAASTPLGWFGSEFVSVSLFLFAESLNSH